MTLRKKTILILCVSALLIVAIAVAASRWILFRRYLDLERENLTLNTRRLESILIAQEDRFASSARDWAVWDSAFEYARSPGKVFETENLVADTFESLEIHFLVFVDALVKILPGKG